MGDRQYEFERVAMPHVDRLLRFACRLTPNRSAANDLLQETFLRAWRAFDRLQPDSAVRAWLFRILINTFLEEGRKAKRAVPVVPLTDGSGASFRNQGSSGKSLDDSLDLLDALDDLPPEQKAVLILSVVEGFTSREVAEILSVPQGTVMSRLSRARQAMRSALTSNLQKAER